MFEMQRSRPLTRKEDIMREAWYLIRVEGKKEEDAKKVIKGMYNGLQDGEWKTFVDEVNGITGTHQKAVKR